MSQKPDDYIIVVIAIKPGTSQEDSEYTEQQVYAAMDSLCNNGGIPIEAYRLLNEEDDFRFPPLRDWP
jgi:hypothetical protein